MKFGKSCFSLVAALAWLAGGSVRAENIVYGSLIDDSSWLFSSFGNQHTLGTTRGANFNGAGSVTWYGVNLSNVSGANGISWSGALASTNQYSYSGIYTGSSPGTAAAANDLTNTGIHGNGTTISISAVAGHKYVVDLLFANAFSGVGAGYVPYRTMDVSVGGLLYADDLTLHGTQSSDRRPLVYRFEFTPSSTSFDITLTNGGVVAGSTTDTNPYVNAVMVTVPEPSAFSLLVLGIGGLIALRRVRRKTGSI